MGYFNQFNLLRAAISEFKEVSRAQLFSEVDRSYVMQKVFKKEPALKELDDFVITNEAIEELNWSKIPEKDKAKILAQYYKFNVVDNYDEVIITLLKFKKKYPNVPAIYNYLGIAYQLSHRFSEYIDCLCETRKLFPDYIFGKTSLAEYFLKTKQHSKIPELFDNKFEINQHFPEILMFHVSVVRGFYSVTGRYFVRVNSIERAYKAYFLLSDLGEDHQSTIALADEILAFEMEAISKMFDSKRIKKKPRKN